jgi:sugar phosphate isomerase/epimerase
MLTLGLNPYGLTYVLGIQGQGGPRANPKGRGLEGYITIGIELGAQVLEFHDPWLQALGDNDMHGLRERLEGLGMKPVVGTGLNAKDAMPSVLRSARLLEADTIRLVLTPILCGDRAAAGGRWDELVLAARAALAEWGPKAADEGRRICIENHQDFTSAELVAFCQGTRGVGITFDTGNPFAVGEAPLDFTRRIAPHVGHVHLKDYRVQPTAEGYRLVRCAIGDGAVPYVEMAAILEQYRPGLTAALEPGALEARHVRLLTADWWRGYPQRQASTLAACLAAARRNRLAEDEDFRTPWEKGEDGALVDYELAMIRRSAANIASLGIAGTSGG